MTDLEINKALARAIGWKPSQISVFSVFDDVFVSVRVQDAFGYRFREFDYKDWNVIGPIAEKYNCFPLYRPYQIDQNRWCVTMMNQKTFKETEIMADTQQKAIALAVIGANK